MNNLSMYQTKEVEIDGEIYNLKKYRALIGLSIQKEIHECGLFTEDLSLIHI